MKKNIFITGASSGIGRACCRVLAQEGHHLIIAARRKEKLDELVQELQSSRASITALKMDVQDKKEVAAQLNSLQLTHLDVLINNAGLSLGKESIEHITLHDWKTMIDTNLKGLMYVTKFALPYLLKSKQAHIINVGSIAGINVYEGGNMYCATKSAVKALSESMRVDLLQYGVKVTNVQPGAVETEFSKVRFKGDVKKAQKVYEGFQPLVAEDLANIIQYCLSLPQHVCINELTVTPRQQANAYYVHKQ